MLVCLVEVLDLTDSGRGFEHFALLFVVSCFFLFLCSCYEYDFGWSFFCGFLVARIELGCTVLMDVLLGWSGICICMTNDFSCSIIPP